MKIEKVLNNNFAIIIGENGEEQIVGGKGIAFGKKPQDTIDADQVNQVFKMSFSQAASIVEEYIENVPFKYFEISRMIIDIATAKIGKELNPNCIFNLSDHIYSAVTRFNNDSELPNFYKWEVKRFYPTEYEVGLEAIEMINKQFMVNLSEDEASFIATHIVDSELETSNLEFVYHTTTLIKEITNIVRFNFNVEYDTESIYYYRFITHIKFFAQRLQKGDEMSKGDDSLHYFIKSRYKNSFDCTEKIGEHLLENYQYSLSKEEQIYLTIHIENVIYKANK